MGVADVPEPEQGRREQDRQDEGLRGLDSAADKALGQGAQQVATVEKLLVQAHAQEGRGHLREREREGLPGRAGASNVHDPHPSREALYAEVDRVQQRPEAETESEVAPEARSWNDAELSHGSPVYQANSDDRAERDDHH